MCGAGRRHAAGGALSVCSHLLNPRLPAPHTLFFLKQSSGLRRRRMGRRHGVLRWEERGGGGNGVGWTKSCGDSAGIGGAVPPRLHQDGAQGEPSLPISARIVSSSGVWSSRPRAGHGPELRRGDERGGSLAGLGPRSVRTVGKGLGGGLVILESFLTSVIP